MADHSDKIDSILCAAIELSTPEERAEYVRRQCRGDASMQQNVEQLLDAHFRAGDFLEVTTAWRQPEPGSSELESPGATIGRYKLLEEIGEGGFGVVFMAEQERPVRRRVALKVIKAGMDTRQVVARFEAERQALAMMDHPSIAKVFDAGATDAGRPYFVMELIKGVPIIKYCDEHQNSIPERLALFVQVCQAVQHAHQKGIIHRDLKPSNVLVTLHDDRPVPKIIDFGVAKAIEGKLTDRTLFTGFHQLVGTPAYMSPEQAQWSSLDVDTRSDIYSLGVLLYELLTGSTPLDSKELLAGPLDEMQRIVREVEPPSPSTRVSTLAADTRVTRANERQVDPQRLAAMLRGDLDWIVMRCLEKDRTRRYTTANSLALDIERYLSDEPVEARPPTATYRLRKFVRRHKLGVAAGSAVILALVIGLVLAAAGMMQARRQARIATAEAAKATAVSNLLLEALQSASPSHARGVNYTVRELLDDVAVSLGDQFKDQPETKAAIHATIGNAYRQLRLAAYAEPHLKTALQLRMEFLGTGHPDVARSHFDYAWNFRERGMDRDAENHVRAALAVHERLGLINTDTIEFHALLQVVLEQQFRHEESDEVARQALTLAREQLGPIPVAARLMRQMASNTYLRGNDAEAVRLGQSAVDMSRELYGSNHAETGFALMFLGAANRGLGNLAEAESNLREALTISRRHFPDEALDILLIREMARLWGVQENMDDLDELRPVIDAIDRSNAAKGVGSTTIAWGWDYCRGDIYAELGELDKAEAAYAKSLNTFLAADYLHEPHARVTHTLALVQLYRANDAAYRDTCAKLVALALRELQIDAVMYAAWTCSLSNEAGVDSDEVLQLARHLVKTDQTDPWNHVVLGAALFRNGQLDEAKTELSAAHGELKGRAKDSRFIYVELLLAMTEWQAGNEADTRRWLAAAETAINEGPQTDRVWNRRAAIELLHREAAELIGEPSHTSRP